MEEKKTRRNKRILIISAMLVLLIALLCFGGTTFAKYITSKDVAVEQATVAKWGFVVNVNTDKMFGDEYQVKEGAVATIDGTNGIVVKALTEGTNVVAPGTKGSMTIKISGNAEVNAKIALKDSEGNDIVYSEDADSAFATWLGAISDVKLIDADATVVHNPVKWTLTGTTVADVTTTKTTLANCLTALVKDIEAVGVIAPSSTELALNYELSWEWAFDGSEQENEYDTLLGYAAAGKGNAGDTLAVGDIVYDGDAKAIKVVKNITPAAGEESESTIEYTTYTYNLAVGFNFKIAIEQTQEPATTTGD